MITWDEALEKRFISVPQWAHLMGMSKDVAYRLARNGEIPGCVSFETSKLFRVNLPLFLELTREQALVG